MCEYCGCRAVTAIAELTREHDLVVGMISHVRAASVAGDTERMAALARQITAVLEAEHRRIEAVLGAAEAGVPADPGWPARLIDILDLLREHILKEQDGVFPAALTSLGGADWDTVDAVRARAGGALQPAGKAYPFVPAGNFSE